jgi:hypothetical protein
MIGEIGGFHGFGDFVFWFFVFSYFGIFSGDWPFCMGKKGKKVTRLLGWCWNAYF